jgi:hypothetical protein
MQVGSKLINELQFKFNTGGRNPMSLRKAALALFVAVLGFLPLGIATSASAGNIDPARLQVQYDANNDTEVQAQLLSAGVLISWYQGFPGRREHAVHLTPLVFDDIYYAQKVCDLEIKPQQANMAASVGYTAITTAGGDAGGLALGAKGAFGAAVSAGAYAVYGAGEGLVTGAVAGVDRHNSSKREQWGQCVINYLNDGQRAGDFPKGFHANLVVDSVEGNHLSRPAPRADDKDVDVTDIGPPPPAVGEEPAEAAH